MVWAASIAAVATLGSAYMSSKSASKAADKQAQGVSDAQAENRREFDITQANQAPYLDAGKTALGRLATENDTPLDTAGIQMDPGYQFGLKQGQQAIDRKTAASGGRISGAALKEAAQYGTDYATTGYSAAYGRANQARTDRLNRLAALAGVGQTATENVGALRANMSGSNSALMTAAGNNAGAAAMAQGNIWGNAGNKLAAIYDHYKPTNAPPDPYSAARNGDGPTDNTYKSYSTDTLFPDKASAGNFDYTPTPLPVDTSTFGDMSWFKG